MEKQCNTCEFNFGGICAGNGNLYKYGEKIVDENACCNEWSADIGYFNQMRITAPRFLREQYNDCRISYKEFCTYFEDFVSGNSVPINFFDAIKSVYGLSMVDIAVVMDVSYGVVYRAKTKGIPVKRITQFTDTLCIEENLLTEITTSDFENLYKSRDEFFKKYDINKHLSLMPRWKTELSRSISSIYFHCPINLADKFARIDKFYWTDEMPLGDYTKSEQELIKYLASHTPIEKELSEIGYFLDLGCKPHLSVTYRDK